LQANDTANYRPQCDGKGSRDDAGDPLVSPLEQRRGQVEQAKRHGWRGSVASCAGVAVGRLSPVSVDGEVSVDGFALSSPRSFAAASSRSSRLRRRMRLIGQAMMNASAAAIATISAQSAPSRLKPAPGPT